MDGWDLALLAIAGYAAIVGLARLMNRRRSQLVNELLEEAARQRRPESRSAFPPGARESKVA